MADFNDIRQQLNKAQNNSSDAQQALLASKEKLNKLTREKDKLNRVFDNENQDYILKQERLDAQIKEAGNDAGKWKATLKRNKENELGIFGEFSAFTDPREQIHNMNDAYPFLLMPVRIETRFKKVNIDEGITDQLWIRIYPDDCAVDSFEKLLSETEVKNAQSYWSQIWQAGGVEEQERGAWRSLVSNHGSGRSSYIINQYQSVNTIDKPAKNNNDDIILVVSTEQIPAAAEKTALVQYWKTLWLIIGQKDKEENAYNDFVAAVGASNADDLIKKYAPANIDAIPSPPKSKEDVEVQVAFLQFPTEDETETKQQSWSQAPHVDVMPDRFVITGFQGAAKAFEIIGDPIPSPLIVGPDPGAEPEEQLDKDEKGNINVGEDMKWMVDFDTAIKNGLGFKVNITSTQAVNGFDRIIALGIRLSADEDKGQEMLETLIDHHRLSRKGLSILKQGTPTNNTETEGAGHQSLDDADESFDELKKDRLFEPESDWFLKKDGQVLAECLGINYESLNKVKNSGHTDQSEGRFMNIALWTATVGYMMETLMKPVFNTNDITNTRNFFNQYISGRGMAPAIKIGRQPYGILPTTAFSKIKWIHSRGDDVGIRNNVDVSLSYLARLYSILRQMDNDWTPLVNNVSHVGKTGGDAHQILLDALGLNPSSVEYYQRNAESVEELFNRLNLSGFGGIILAIIIAASYVQSGKDLLNKFGYSGTEVPDILNKFFLQSQNLLKGPLIDDRPLSETDIIRKYTPDPDSKNYIDWLINAAETSHDALRKQEGFIDGKIPSALLYLMLHHALDLSYVEVSLLLFQKANLISNEQVLAAKTEAPFVHIQQNAKTTESKWQYLYSKSAEITGDNDLLVGQYIPKIIKTEVASEYLKEQLNALEQLKNVPTARLERAFAEHVDCCTYRLDAWRSGIINFQLTGMRQVIRDEEETYRRGIYIGAYGWLENVKSENKNLTPVELEDQELSDIFIKDEAFPLVKDNTNGGYIMAPSLNHAVTAAVLRNGYMSNNDPEALRVNLSSERVRKMLSVVEGIRGGQSLGALLGYYLERGLHDGHPGIELDFFIYQLRKAFPLVTNRNKDTKVDETSEQPIDSVEAIEARNVIDGLSLIEHIKKSDNAGYPFGITFLEAVDNPAQATAINEEVQKIMDINDAVADVALAESVHQIVQGNYDRGASTLDTFSKGNFPPIPDVIQTPRSGINITHRVGLHFEVGIDPVIQPTPRAQAEPAVNKWLASVLPGLPDIVCSVSYGAVSDEVISVADLFLQPIDLLYIINTDQDQAMKEIDDLVIKFVLDKPGVRPDTIISVDYMKQVSGKFNFFETAPLMNSLRSILLRSRPLTPNDIILANDATTTENGAQSLDAVRIELRVTTLETLLNTPLTDFKDAIELLVSDVSANRNQILAEINQLMNDLTAILFELTKSGFPQSGFGFIYDRKKIMYAALIQKLDALIKRWDDKLVAFDDFITEYSALPGTATVEEKMALLEKARREISTIAETTFPSDPDDYRDDLLTLRGGFIAKQNQFKTIFSAHTKSVSALLSNIKAQFPVSDFDLVPLELTDVEDQVILFARELASKAVSLHTDLSARITKAKALIDESKTTTDNKKQIDFVLDAAKQLFHEDFKMIPEFSMPPERADEWQKSFNATNQLLDYSINSEKTDFPVDDWLYGVARVREKMQHWENITVLSEAFEKPPLELHPVQLPFKEDDSWLALTYPEDYDIESDRLLYTAHYTVSFNKTQAQCGVLLDEWTEIIPSKKETAGVTFHYDRPNTEPPQVMLLALPTEFKGAWQWQDLMDTLMETFDMAQKRAVEPADIDTTSYARFLPAIISSMTVHPITSSLNYAFNNNLHESLIQNQ